MKANSFTDTLMAQSNMSFRFSALICCLAHVVITSIINVRGCQNTRFSAANFTQLGAAMVILDPWKVAIIAVGLRLKYGGNPASSGNSM